MKGFLFITVFLILVVQCCLGLDQRNPFTEINTSRGHNQDTPNNGPARPFRPVSPQELPARWLVIRSFMVFTDEADIPPPHRHKSGSMDAHCAPASASACLRYPDPDRTDCLLLVARNLDRQVKRQQDNIAVLTGLLQERGRVLGLHIHQFLVFLLPAFLFLVLLRCCTRKKTYKRIVVETEGTDEESPNTSTSTSTTPSEKTVTSFSLSGETATAMTYKLDVPSSKVPPRLHSSEQTSSPASSSSEYPGLALPTAYYQQ